MTALGGFSSEASAQTLALPAAAYSSHDFLLREPLREPLRERRVYVMRDAVRPYFRGFSVLRRADVTGLLEAPEGLSPLDEPKEYPAGPAPVVVAINRYASNYFRMSPITGWTWVNLGLGAASVGLAQMFFQLAGGAGSMMGTRAAGSSTGDDPMALTFGAYAVRYDTAGEFAMRTGISTLTSSVMRLAFAPRDPREVRYLQTFVTELRDGWVVGLQGAM